MINPRYFTGIGSRETPEIQLKLMSDLAGSLYKSGFILRSGGAEGADTAFEHGLILALRGLDFSHPEFLTSLKASSEIYLPFRGFNGNQSHLFNVSGDALALAATVHPAWVHLKEVVRKLHARNCYQVLGRDLRTPSEFLVCWTKDGCDSEKTRNSKTGGTGTAIALAERSGVPVFNLATPKSCVSLAALLESKGVMVPLGLVTEEPAIVRHQLNFFL